MSRKSRPSTSEELKLWSQYTAELDWRKLDPADGKESSPPAPKASKQSASQGKGVVGSALQVRPKTDEKIPDLQPIDAKTYRKLGRKEEAIGAVLDLHHLTQDQAKLRLKRFIEQERARSTPVVMVITGKGRGGDGNGQGILQRAVRYWLEEKDFRASVIGYAEAHRHRGGTGALYLRLRRLRGSQ